MKDEREPGNAGTFYNERTGNFQRKESVAQQLVGSGNCSNYTEAYAILNGMKSGQIVLTTHGAIRK